MHQDNCYATGFFANIAEAAQRPFIDYCYLPCAFFQLAAHTARDRAESISVLLMILVRIGPSVGIFHLIATFEFLFATTA